MIDKELLLEERKQASVSEERKSLSLLADDLWCVIFSFFSILEHFHLLPHLSSRFSRLLKQTSAWPPILNLSYYPKGLYVLQQCAHIKFRSFVHVKNTRTPSLPNEDLEYLSPMPLQEIRFDYNNALTDLRPICKNPRLQSLS